MILTRQNLSDAQNLADCRAEFLKADSILGPERPFKLAEWALNWGEAIFAVIDEGVDETNDQIVSLCDQITELKSDHKQHLSEIRDAHVEAEEALRDLGKVIEQ